MAQVDYLLPAVSHVSAADEGFSNALHVQYLPSPMMGMVAHHKYVHAEEDFTGASSLPTPPPDELESCDLPSASPIVSIPGLPQIFTGASEDLIRSQILQAALDAEMNEIDAEKAFFVADLGVVYEQFARFRRCLPEVEPFYAVKCNPDPYVIRLLAALGTGFDCASHNEIKQILDIGVEPSRIIFANPCKSVSFIRHAAKGGVDTMTFDNTDELYKIARTHRGARLVVRILTDDSKSLCRLGLKFGAPLSSVPALLATARELGLDVVGVSFHVGSGNYDTNAFDDAVSRAAQAFGMGTEAGYRFTLLDVGGGFEHENFEQTAAVLRRALQTYFPGHKQRGIKIIAEPGRYFVSEAFRLAANIIARRISPAADATQESVLGDMEMDDVVNSVAVTAVAERQPSVMYYINDGVYGAFNCIMFDHQVATPFPLTVSRSPVTVEPGGGEKAGDKLSSVWGPTCDSIDCVAPLCYLPGALDVGDWLGFNSMGAYTICAASNFNGFETSIVHYTSGAGAEQSAAVRKALSVYNA